MTSLHDTSQRQPWLRLSSDSARRRAEKRSQHTIRLTQGYQPSGAPNDRQLKQLLRPARFRGNPARSIITRIPEIRRRENRGLAADPGMYMWRKTRIRSTTRGRPGVE